MNVLVTSYTDGKKIHAIKGIRGATGLSLKDAKHVADRVEAGTPTKITLADPSGEQHLEEYGVAFVRIPVAVSLGDFIEILSRYPRHHTVGDVIDVLRVANDLAHHAKDAA